MRGLAGRRGQGQIEHAPDRLILKPKLSGRTSFVPQKGGPWGRPGQRLRLCCRPGQGLAFGLALGLHNDVLSSAVVVDSRSHHSAPTCFALGIDCGKWIKSIKRQVICSKHGPVLELELTPANLDDRASAGPMLSRLLTFSSKAICWATPATRASPSQRPRGCMTVMARRRRAEREMSGLCPNASTGLSPGTTPCSTATPIC